MHSWGSAGLPQLFVMAGSSSELSTLGDALIPVVNQLQDIFSQVLVAEGVDLIAEPCEIDR